MEKKIRPYLNNLGCEFDLVCWGMSQFSSKGFEFCVLAVRLCTFNDIGTFGKLFVSLLDNHL